ncbi:MAG: hypothetical protein ACYCR3_09195 [Acidithiobacillus sp.]
MKPLLNAVALVVVASAMTVSAPALSSPALSASDALGATQSPSAGPSQSAGLPGAANALNRLSEMKIRHAVLAESLQNIQIEAQIKAVEKKMNGATQGVSSERIPVVSLLTCSGTVHCAATLLLPNGARVSAYPGTVIGNGLTVVGVTEQGVLAADGSSRFYLPFSGGVTSPLQGAAKTGLRPAGFGSQGLANTLPPPVLGGATMNTTTPPAGMLPAGMQSPSGSFGGMQ